MKTREEHLIWCKMRALGYVKKGDLDNAVASMVSDLSKHDGTRSQVELMVMLGRHQDTPEKLKKFIEGFN